MKYIYGIWYNYICIYIYNTYGYIYITLEVNKFRFMSKQLFMGLNSVYSMWLHRAEATPDRGLSFHWSISGLHLSWASTLPTPRWTDPGVNGVPSMTHGSPGGRTACPGAASVGSTGALWKASPKRNRPQRGFRGWWSTWRRLALNSNKCQGFLRNPTHNKRISPGQNGVGDPVPI